MSRICYIERSFYTKARAVVDQANAICEEYAAQGLDLTLRQLYYQFVARGLIANKQSEYDRLGSIVNDARLAGDLDWEFIVDRTRNLMGISHHDSPADLIRDAARRFHTDKWSNQPTRVEVWVEKDALVGVLESVCPSEDVDFFACRGYVSQSEMWAAAQRIERYIIAKQAVLVLHLGDHDPSGIDMTRDVRERLELFIREDLWNSAVNDLEVKRIALNMDQIGSTTRHLIRSSSRTSGRMATSPSSVASRGSLTPSSHQCWSISSVPKSRLAAILTFGLRPLAAKERCARR